ncbi:MAG: cbb3-type cytochrome c oxidase subunit I [Gemmatimonadales bacterium]|jgi:nitric oxide reductase subunit B
MTYRSQRVAEPYFLAAAVLFVLQVVFGLIIAAQYVWPTLFLDTLPFNVGRATHLNLLVFWLLLALMGASYYLLPEETESDLLSPGIAYTQLAVLLLAGVGTLVSFWFLGGSRGKPFTESPYPWPLLIVLGAVLFLINVIGTLVKAKRLNAITFVLAVGMTGLAGMYLVNLVPFDNLSVDYYWWWWIIHLWVEGFWELIAAAIAAFLLIKLTGVARHKMYRWLYLEVSLVLFTGIIGIGHHYYWIGTPDYWLFWGALFSALEPIPIALMAYDAFRSMRERPIAANDRVPAYFVIGTAIGHLVGAGIWGFAITLPQINKWTHGTQLTASHGHFAFFGAFALLALAAAYYMLPRLRATTAVSARRGLWSFWLMTTGMLAMVLSFTIAGVVQTYLFRLLGMDFMTVRTEYVAFWMFWVWAFGLILFLPGALLGAWDLFLVGRRRVVRPTATPM